LHLWMAAVSSRQINVHASSLSASFLGVNSNRFVDKTQLVT
jgi:hypothetical protein